MNARRRAAHLAGILVLGAIGVFGLYLRGAGPCSTPADNEVDVGAIEAAARFTAQSDAGPDAAKEAGAKACAESIAIEVRTEGSFTHTESSRPLGSPIYPSVVGAFMHHVALGAHGYAAAYSIADLCSAEEVSPSYIRLFCLGPKGVPRKIEYRVDATVVAQIVDASPNPELWEIPAKTCVTLETKIPKRDLGPLAKTYQDDSVSERCKRSKAPRRSVSATLIRSIDPSFVSRGSRCSKGQCCFATTGVQLAIPLAGVGPSQDLGLLAEQCYGPCDVSGGLGSVHAWCSDGGTIGAYQLGDALYILDDDHVRKVPLPCGVELDFRVEPFAAGLLPKG